MVVSFHAEKKSKQTKLYRYKLYKKVHSLVRYVQSKNINTVRRSRRRSIGPIQYTFGCAGPDQPQFILQLVIATVKFSYPHSSMQSLPMGAVFLRPHLPVGLDQIPNANESFQSSCRIGYWDSCLCLQLSAITIFTSDQIALNQV